MITAYQGASVRAIQHHYDTGNAFYRLWLDPTLTYSCAMWDEREPDEALGSAQTRKLDFHIQQAHAAGQRRVLDVGCGWGSLLRRMVEIHGVQQAVGLTLSVAQAESVRALDDPRIAVREENWFDHRPDARYDAILSVAAFEAFARPDLDVETKIAAYRGFFECCHAWLMPGGWMSLQTIAWGNTRPEDSSQFIEREIFPESDLPRLAEIASAVAGLFEVVALRNDRQDYERTCRVWLARLDRARPAAEAVAGPDLVERYRKYLKLARIAFHTGKLDLYRITLRRIDRPRL